LAIRSSQTVKDQSSDRDFICLLHCLHDTVYKKKNSYHKSSVSSEKQRGEYKTSTKRAADKESDCPFQIKLFLQKESATKCPGRKFLCSEPSSKNDTCCYHRNHFELDAGHMRVPMQMMTEEEKLLAKDCAQLYFMHSTDVPAISAEDADEH
jgi:hypothetical protein